MLNENGNNTHTQSHTLYDQVTYTQWQNRMEWNRITTTKTHIKIPYDMENRKENATKINMLRKIAFS